MGAWRSVGQWLACETEGMAQIVKAWIVSCMLVTATFAFAQNSGAAAKPPPPRLPRDFTWTGRYEVPDLGVDVPFTWHGDAGNTQMIAGGDAYPIHFTNLIYNGVLFTLTYKWPNIERRPCSRIGPFTLKDLNAALEKAHFVGPETLEGNTPRKVNHFRTGIVFELPTNVVPAIPGVGSLRIPLALGDIYADRKDPSKFWQVLQFGIQNLYAPEQDEWIRIGKISDKPGKVTLPEECSTVPAAPPSAP